MILVGYLIDCERFIGIVFIYLMVFWKFIKERNFNNLWRGIKYFYFKVLEYEGFFVLVILVKFWGENVEDKFLNSLIILRLFGGLNYW